MQIPKSTILKTDRLVLRIPQLEEIPAIFAATRHPGFNDGMLWDPPQSQDEMLAPFHRNEAAWERGDAYGFSIYLRLEDQFVGRISIRKTEEEGVWNIGFWTLPEQQGQGIMSEAVEAMLRFGFDTLSAGRIEACYAIWNKASERVLQKNGFSFLRYIEQGFQKNGAWVPENLLGIDCKQWKEVHNVQ